MKVILMMLMLIGSVIGQEYVGRTPFAAYYINKVERKGDKVSFLGLASQYEEIDNKIVLDKNNYQIMDFRANCLTHEYYAVYMKQVDKGVLTEGELEPVVAKAVKPQLIFLAIEKACKPVQKGIAI